MPLIGQHAIDTARRFSSYLDRLLTAYPSLEKKLIAEYENPITQYSLYHFAHWDTLTQPETLAPVLRQLKQTVLARLIVRDLAGYATLDEVVTTLSELADFSIQCALPVVYRSLEGYGDPIGTESGEQQALTVVGMGKLGGRELNASSDIDLIFIYPESGETNGKRRISNHEYFTLAGKKLIALLDDVTPEGRVFRVDMRLRPYGESGPLVLSLSALENYLITQGREWERYAWIKARAITGAAQPLYDLVRPFVYRKYLDYNAYGAMRELHAQIRREVMRRDKINDIKLGPGGIREIEFIAQVFQLIRGGRERRLQKKGTREILALLETLNLLDAQAVEELIEAYTFLRNVEHRLQYVDDQQTQRLPDQPILLDKLAISLGFSAHDTFLHALNTYRQRVSRHFEQVFFLPTESTYDHPLSCLWSDILETDISPDLAALGYQAPHDAAWQLKNLATSQRYRQMALTNQKRFDTLIPPLIEVAASFPNPDSTLSRIINLMEAISRRASYLALLSEYPQTLQRIASLYSASAWVSTYLTHHPILLDELLDIRVLYALPDWEVLAASLIEQLNAAYGDVEHQMDILRHFQHTQTFRLVVQDLAGMWPLEALSDQLSFLADCVLAATLQAVWSTLPQRHEDNPHFAIIGYGKLGGKELGYASDLDLIFLYDDPHPEATEIYSRLARKMVAWLTSTTPAGILYDIDLRLRPNGTSGLLVSTVSAFERYQQSQAWVWEHQALTRARFVAGDLALGDRFNIIRHTVLTQARDPSTLKADIITMRQRIRNTHPPCPENVKHAWGGIIDIEFIVQYLVLAHAKNYPELVKNSGNIALLGTAAEAGLIDTTLATLCQVAYRYFRREQHVARLSEQQHTVVTPTLEAHYQHGCQLWQQLFE